MGSGRLFVGSGRLSGWVGKTDGWVGQVGEYVKWLRKVGWEGRFSLVCSGEL